MSNQAPPMSPSVGSDDVMCETLWSVRARSTPAKSKGSAGVVASGPPWAVEGSPRRL